MIYMCDAHQEGNGRLVVPSPLNNWCGRSDVDSVFVVLAQ